jgi:hypothetical protein
MRTQILTDTQKFSTTPRKQTRADHSQNHQLTAATTTISTDARKHTKNHRRTAREK